MRREVSLGLLLMALSAALAHAAAVSPPGVNLRWDKCYGDGGVMYKQFACDTNTGFDRLVMSFELAAPFSQMSGIEVVLDLESASAPFPAWWAFKSAGTCRINSLVMTPIPTGNEVNCVDWAGGLAAGGLAGYIIDSFTPNTARMIAGFVIAPPLADLVPGQEYFAGIIRIDHVKTVGPTACGGCDVPVCLVFDQAHLATPPVQGQPSGDLRLYRGANFVGSQIAGWQNGYTTNFVPGGPHPPPGGVPLNATFTCVPYSATPARPSTWGQVKSLYR